MWEEDAAAWMETETQSPPAIHYLKDGVYTVAWNNGAENRVCFIQLRRGACPFRI